MTTFEITIIVLLSAIVVLLMVLLRTSIEGFHGVWKKQDTILGDTMVLKAYFNNLLERFDNISRQLDNIEGNILDDLRAIKLTCVLSEKMLRDGYNESQITKQAVVLSDALVEELKKKHNNANI